MSDSWNPDLHHRFQDEGPFAEPLGLFLDSLESEADLNEIGRLIASERALMHTVAADVGDDVPPSPPQRETFGTDPRIALAASFLPDPENQTESERQFRAMHPMGAELTQECVKMMGESMCTPLFHNQIPATAGCSRRAPTCGASTTCCAPTRTKGSCSRTATR